MYRESGATGLDIAKMISGESTNKAVPSTMESHPSRLTVDTNNCPMVVFWNLNEVLDNHDRVAMDDSGMCPVPVNHVMETVLNSAAAIADALQARDIGFAVVTVGVGHDLGISTCVR